MAPRRVRPAADTTVGPALRPVVMTDVARLAGVSHQTVSRVLNDHPNVRRETRERVLHAIRQLGYRPNPLARGLAGRHSRVLGVVGFDTILYGPAATLLGLERAARAAGYGVSIAALERLDPAGVAAAVGGLAEQSVAGIVVIAPLSSATAAVRHLRPGVPVVVVESGPATLPAVSVDQALGARLAVEHLIALGHRGIAHVRGPAEWLDTQQRVEGWRAALGDAGLPAPAPVGGDWSPQSGYDAAAEIAGRAGVTAVFCANDQQALGLLRWLHERRVRVPADLSVVGFDDIPEARFLTPPLTTVRQDFDEVGRRCLATLLALLAGPPSPPAHALVAPVLVVRESTGPPPGR